MKTPTGQKTDPNGSCGRLVSGMIAKVIKPDGSLAEIGEPGELYVKGPQIVMGYYRNDEA